MDIGTWSCRGNLGHLGGFCSNSGEAPDHAEVFMTKVNRMQVKTPIKIIVLNVFMLTHNMQSTSKISIV